MKKLSSYVPHNVENEEDKEKFADLFEETLSDETFKTVLTEKKNLDESVSSASVAGKAGHPSTPQAQLDLHGHTLHEAQRKTKYFLENCRHQGLYLVRIITGKGLHSKGEAVLPAGIEQTLKELEVQGEICSFQWEKTGNRQSGALLVFLS